MSEASVLDVPLQCWHPTKRCLATGYKIYVSYYFLVAGLLVVIFGFNTLLSTTYLIFAEKANLVGSTVSLVLTQSYLFSSIVSNTLTTVHDLWRPEPHTCLHARRYLAYFLTGLSWLQYHVGLMDDFGDVHYYDREEVHSYLVLFHLAAGLGIPLLAWLVGFLASGTVTGVTYFTFTATVVALFLIAVRFLCVWVEGLAEKGLWVRYGLCRLVLTRPPRPPTDAFLASPADEVEHALAAFGLDPRSMKISLGFLAGLFGLVAGYAALNASPEYQLVSDSFLFFGLGALVLLLVYIAQPRAWALLWSGVLRCHLDLDPEFHHLISLITSTSITLLAYGAWVYLTLKKIGHEEPAFWGFLLCLAMVQGCFTRKAHKRRLLTAERPPGRLVPFYDAAETPPPPEDAPTTLGTADRAAHHASYDTAGASRSPTARVGSASDAGTVTGQPQATLLAFVGLFMLLSMGMISVGQQIALPRYGPQHVAVISPSPTSPDPESTRYPLCFYRWLQNKFTIIDFAFLSQLAYYSPENFRSNLEIWYPQRRLNLTASERDNSAIHQATFYDVHDLETGASVVVVRGTIDAMDVLQDARIWGDSGLLAVFHVLGPFVSVWSLEQTTLYIRLSALFSRYLRTRSTNYMYDLEEYVRAIVPHRSEVILTGHSLGGGLAKLVSAKLEVWSVTFSSPGIVWARVAADSAIPLDSVDTYTMTIVPRGDFLSSIDLKGGQTIYIDCPPSARTSRGLLGCHYLSSTICTLLHRCGDPDPLSPDFSHPRFLNRSLLGCTPQGTYIGRRRTPRDEQEQA